MRKIGEEWKVIKSYFKLLPSLDIIVIEIKFV